MRAKLALCLVLALAAAGAAQAAEVSLAQAEEGLRAAEMPPSRENWQDSSLRSRVAPLDAAFRSAAKRNPEQAYRGLGRCKVLVGQYREAAIWFHRAAKLAPSNRAAAADLRRAQQFATIARAAGRLLPEGTVVLQVAPLRGDARGLWALLSAAIGPAMSFTNDNFYEGARLRLLRETRRRPRLIWRSDVLSVRIGPGPGWTNEIRMYVLKERPLKVLVEEVSYGADSARSHVDAFAWQGRGLIAVPVVMGETDHIGAPPANTTFASFSASAFDSEIPPWILDLGHNGQHEVVTLNRIGSGLAIAAMVFWPSIYVYERGAYVLADGRFPKAYIEIGEEIRQRLKEHPNDYELLKYLGIYYEIQGDPAAALDAYRRALTAHTAQQQAPSESEEREAADIRARIRRLGG